MVLILHMKLFYKSLKKNLLKCLKYASISCPIIQTYLPGSHSQWLQLELLLIRNVNSCNIIVPEQSYPNISILLKERLIFLYLFKIYVQTLCSINDTWWVFEQKSIRHMYLCIIKQYINKNWKQVHYFTVSKYCYSMFYHHTLWNWTINKLLHDGLKLSISNNVFSEIDCKKRQIY